METRRVAVVLVSSVLVSCVLVSPLLAGCNAQSPDAGTITFTRYDGNAGHVIAVDRTSGDESELTTASGVQAHSIAAPDGSFIAYSQVDAASGSPSPAIMREATTST